MNKNYIIAGSILLIFVILGFYFLLQKPANNQPVGEQKISSKDSQNQTMKIEILINGSGEGAKTGDLVTVNYVGTLENGQKFDSSIDRKQPFQFTLGQNRVIQGWEYGIKEMKVGEKRRLIIPPELGYGSEGAGNIIPPNATLIFEVEMLKIEPAK